jgi:hypothetical protein
MTVEHFEESYEVGSKAKLVVKNIRGSVTVVPGTEGIIKVRAEKILNDCTVDDLKLEVFQEENGTVIARVQQPERFTVFGSYRPCKANFEIEAPPTADLQIKTVSASVTANGFSGDIKIKTVSGSQTVENLNGILDLNTLSGKIVGHQLQGEARISTVSDLLRLTEGNFSSLRAKTVSGKIEAQTALTEGPYHFSSVSGAVKLVVPEDSNCEVQASGVSGRFYTDLDLRSSDLGNRSWRVTVGEGSTIVRIKTVSGRMSLLSSFDAKGSRPGYIQKSKAERTSVLNKLNDGELSVEEALKELS